MAGRGKRSMSRKASRKASRKNRKASRKASRRNRRASRRCWSRRNNVQMGGMPILSPAGVDDQTMMGPSNLSAAQGKDYQNIHAAQHGGAYVSLDAAAPVGYTGMLDDSLRATARVTPIDGAIGAIQGMRDQSGGGKRSGSRRGASRKMFAKLAKKGKGLYVQLLGVVRKPMGSTRKMLKNLRKGMRKAGRSMRRRMQRGGAGYSIGPNADYSAPGMLLPSAMEAKALMGMNPEWKLAADPTSFAPKL